MSDGLEGNSGNFIQLNTPFKSSKPRQLFLLATMKVGHFPFTGFFQCPRGTHVFGAVYQTYGVNPGFRWWSNPWEIPLSTSMSFSCQSARPPEGRDRNFRMRVYNTQMLHVWQTHLDVKHVCHGFGRMLLHIPYMEHLARRIHTENSWG